MLIVTKTLPFCIQVETKKNDQTLLNLILIFQMSLRERKPKKPKSQNYDN